jgi:hypothetical protein
VLARVRMRVVRSVISCTWPWRSATRTQSPTWNGLSQKITKPAMMLASESWAAKPTAMPATPRPATAAPTLMPTWSAAMTRATATRIPW